MRFSLETDCCNGEKSVFEGITAPFVGEHAVYDAAIAVLVGLECGVSIADIGAGLGKYIPCGSRQRVTRANGVTRIADCYNSGPESVRAALSAMRILSDKYGCKRKIAVLGDMLELGDCSVSEHIRLGAELKRYGVDILFAVGDLGAEICRGALENGFLEDSAVAFVTDCDYGEIKRIIEFNLKDGDIILYKASRGMRLEALLP